MCSPRRITMPNHLVADGHTGGGACAATSGSSRIAHGRTWAVGSILRLTVWRRSNRPRSVRHASASCCSVSFGASATARRSLTSRRSLQLSGQLVLGFFLALALGGVAADADHAGRRSPSARRPDLWPPAIGIHRPQAGCDIRLRRCCRARQAPWRWRVRAVRRSRCTSRRNASRVPPNVPGASP